jgi:predicted component of type VI protein secretion system
VQLIRIDMSLPPITLSSDQVPFTLGRGADNSIVLDDRTSSRTHAILDCKVGNWLITDTSRNGTEVSRPGQATVKLRGKVKSLQDGDVLVFGSIAYRFSRRNGGGAVDAEDETPPLTPKVRVTRRQYDVLMELSAALRDRPGEPPPSNQEISEALFLSHDAVRGHLSELYRAFEIDEGTQVQRRLRLASQWWRAEVK